MLSPDYYEVPMSDDQVVLWVATQRQFWHRDDLRQGYRNGFAFVSDGRIAQVSGSWVMRKPKPSGKGGKC